jgi:hypothetical protein
MQPISVEKMTGSSTLVWNDDFNLTVRDVDYEFANTLVIEMGTDQSSRVREVGD